MLFPYLQEIMKRILLVEDEPDDAELIIEFLSEKYDLKWFSRATDIIKFLDWPDTERPDLILLDINLPGIDGLTLLRMIRSLKGCKNIPAIAVTAHAEKGDRKRILAEGFDGHVGKPITDEETLVNEIERKIEISKGR